MIINWKVIWNITIPTYYFVIIIALSTAYLTFLTTKGGLTDNRFSKPLEKITKRGRKVILLLFFMLLLLLAQECNNNNLKHQSEATLKNETDTRDAAITTGVNKGVQANRKRLFNDISVAFNKQGLVLDTLNEEVRKLDSSNRSRKYNSQPDPVLFIGTNGVQVDAQTDTSFHCSISLMSNDAGSTNFNLRCFILIKRIDGTYSLFRKHLASHDDKISKNLGVKSGFGLSEMLTRIKEIDFYIKGNYTTLDGSKSYNINNVYVYNPATKIVGFLFGAPKKKVIQIIKKALNYN